MKLGGPVFGIETKEGKADPAAFAEAHVKAGYQAAYCPEFLHPGQKENNLFSKELMKRGILWAEAGAWCNPLTADEKEARKNREYMIERLALAEELGAKTCVNIAGTFSSENWYGPHEGNYSEDFFALAVDTVRYVLDAVKPRRTTFSVEIMPYNFLDGPQAYLHFLKAVDRKQAAVHLDPCNCICSPRIYCHISDFLKEAFSLLGDRIVSVHLKDITMEQNTFTAAFREVPPGEGHMDYPLLLRLLNHLPADTPAMLEHLPDEAAYRKAFSFVRRIQEEIQ